MTSGKNPNQSFDALYEKRFNVITKFADYLCHQIQLLTVSDAGLFEKNDETGAFNRIRHELSKPTSIIIDNEVTANEAAESLEIFPDKKFLRFKLPAICDLTNDGMFDQYAVQRIIQVIKPLWQTIYKTSKRAGSAPPEAFSITVR